MAKHVLIIDDDPEIVDFLSDILADNGFETSTAYDGVEGLEKARAGKPDLITLDMDMPEKGGTLFYAALRRDEAIRNIPVIVVSGVGPRPPQLTKNVVTLSKPIAEEDLLEVINETLS